MKSKLNPAIITCCVAATSARAQTFAIESDIRPRVEAARIVTDAVDDKTQMVVPNVVYFGYEFQSDPKDPYFLEDPGFNAVPGSGLTPFSTLSFNVVRHLAYWSGSGSVSFTTPPNSESLQFSFGAASVTINGTSGVQDGFSLGNVAADGSLHRHLNALLLGPDTTTDPTDGVYFTNTRLLSSDGVTNPSDSLYIVYNNGASAAAFESALDYLSDPIPGDANFDGIVNLQDFNILAGNFGGSERFWYEGDFNRDRLVTLADFNLLAANFGQAAGSYTSIPEPSLLLLPALSLLGLQRTRLRK